MIYQKNKILKNLFPYTYTAKIKYYEQKEIIAGDPFINLKIGKILKIDLNFDNNNLKPSTIGTLE